MGPLWFIRMARMVRRPPPLWKVLLVLGVVAAAGVIIGIEQITGIELEERNMNWRRGPALEVAQ
ncbi:MAG: hypothetical protein AAFP13_10705 [Pseudomonadota bacterium]